MTPEMTTKKSRSIGASIRDNSIGSVTDNKIGNAASVIRCVIRRAETSEINTNGPIAARYQLHSKATSLCATNHNPAEKTHDQNNTVKWNIM